MLNQPRWQPPPRPTIPPLRLRMQQALKAMERLQEFNLPVQNIALNADGALVTLPDNTKADRLQGRLRGHSNDRFGHWVHYEAKVEHALVRWRISTGRVA